MVFDIQPHERDIFHLISEAAEELNSPAYVVGGYVRDRLLARPSKDLDIVCVGNGIELANLVGARLRPRARVTVYKRFGTAMLKHQGVEIEFVGARKESYRSDSRKPLVEAGTLEDDQNRRDFTINALAISLNAHNYGAIIDPFNGLEHLEQKLLKTPLEPGKTFSDDPLRMLRGIRFSAQLGFRIDPETYAAISRNKNRINIISWERIATELNKMLTTSQPSGAFKQLFDTGLLRIILPELADLQGVDVRDGVRHKDNFFHTLKVVDNLARRSHSLWLRWAALLHDIGKARTKRFSKDRGWTFDAHDAVGAKMVPKIFKRLRLSLDQMKYVQKLVALHQRPIALTSEEISDSAVRRILFEAGEDIDDLLLLCESDITSRNSARVARYLENYERLRQRMAEIEEKDHLRNWQPPISGEVIMDTFGLQPSREVGIIKNAIREAILDGAIANDYDQAYEYMIAQGEELGLHPVTSN